MSYRDPNRERAAGPVITEARAALSAYSAPGLVADLDTADLVKQWNVTIEHEYHRLANRYGSRFFSLDPSSIPDPTTIDVVKWAADPAEPNFCFDAAIAQRISDWDLAAAHPVHAGRGIQGRREVHNEYCEYKVIYRCDSARNLKPKRVILTTELRDYWLMLAEISPSRLKFAASDALKREVDWEELYGFGVKDPELLSPQERKRLFAVWVAGAAQDEALAKQGVPTYPIGTLNNYNALFMYHPINGLDDLLYIVMFGAHPYARKEGDIWVRPTKDEIFSKPFFGEPTAPVHLACRHADPAAATGAASKAFEGRTIAFANPFGMYIRSFSSHRFFLGDKPIPMEWVRLNRGAKEGLFQRLEFGPGDSDPEFLSDISVGEGGEPVVGGYQLAENIEVGPLLLESGPTVVSDEEYNKFEVQSVQGVSCGLAAICRKMTRLNDEYEELAQ